MRPLDNQADKLATPHVATVASGELDSGLSLKDIFRMITNHWLFLVICVVFCVVVSYLYARSLTPIYEAAGTMRLDPGRVGSLGFSIAGASGGGDELGTEIAIIQSDSVAARTLNSLTDDEFRRFAGAPKSKVAFPVDAVNLTTGQENLLAAIKGGLKAQEVGTTQLIQVSFRSSDPQLAAVIANDAIAAYLKQSFRSRYESVETVKSYLAGEMNDLRNQAIESQSKLTEFQEKNNILITGKDSNSTLDALKSISSDLTAARAAMILHETQMRAVSTGAPEVVASLFPSPSMTGLQGQRASVTAQINQLSSKFDESYPPLIEARRQLQKVDSQFDSEIGMIKSRTKQEYDTAQTTVNLLQEQYDAQLAKAFALNKQEATYGELISESTASRELYDQLQKSLQQAGVTAGLSSVNSMLVDQARTPRFPVEPKRTVIVGFGLMLGLFAGLGATFLMEIMTDSAKSDEELEHVMRSHILAVVPHIEDASKMPPVSAAVGQSRMSPAVVTYRSPLSRAAESFRNLRNGVLLSGDNVKTILVTSTLAGEGKSSSVANFAVVLAQNGARVLVIDADLRLPRLHALFGLENLRGLSNLILGEDVPDAMHTPLPDLPNLSVLTAGKRVTLPSEALGSTRMYNLLTEWEKEYDYVLIDSAPLLLVSDSLPLSRWADATLLVVRYGMVPKTALRRLRAVMGQAQTQLTGLVFNDVPLKNVGYGAYGYRNGYGYYE